jgi:Phosphoserine aminotransferase
VVIIDRELAGNELPYTPQIMSYKMQINSNSMLNTPPCWNIYMLSLILDWIEENGGIEGMEELRTERAGRLYDYLDESKLFIPHARPGSRSEMNVTFRTGNDETDVEFVQFAASKGLVNLKGHRLTGGMRASLYNAMPVEGVDKLIECMKEFEQKHV